MYHELSMEEHMRNIYNMRKI